MAYLTINDLGIEVIIRAIFTIAFVIVALITGIKLMLKYKKYKKITLLTVTTSWKIFEQTWTPQKKKSGFFITTCTFFTWMHYFYQLGKWQTFWECPPRQYDAGMKKARWMQILEHPEIIEGITREESSTCFIRKAKKKYNNNAPSIQECPVHGRRSRATWSDKHEWWKSKHELVGSKYIKSILTWAPGSMTREKGYSSYWRMPRLASLRWSWLIIRIAWLDLDWISLKSTWTAGTCALRWSILTWWMIRLMRSWSPTSRPFYIPSWESSIECGARRRINKSEPCRPLKRIVHYDDLQN